MPGTVGPAALAWIARLADELDEAALLELAQTVRDHILAAMPAELAGVDLERDVLALTRGNLRAFLADAPLERWPAPLVPPSALTFARAVAQDGWQLDDLLMVYRLGQRAFWRAMMGVAQARIADAEVRDAVLTALWDRSADWIEVVVQGQAAIFHEERARWMRGAAARRAEVVAAILDRQPVDVREAERVLGHELHQHQLAFVLWVDDAAPLLDAADRLEALAGELAAALGASRPLTVPSGARGLWAWVRTAGAPDPAALRPVAEASEGSGLRVAAGRPSSGIGGFRDSHVEALEAQRLAGVAQHPDVLVDYADVEFLCLLSHDEAGLRRFVRRELAGLLAGDPMTRRLRETLTAFLRAHGNARLAAEALGVHKNTVIYRVRNAEEQLGHMVLERRMELEAALRAVELFGEGLLEGEASGRAVPGSGVGGGPVTPRSATRRGAGR